MTFVKGQSGNPGGQQKDKQFADALRLVINRDEPDGKKKLAKVAEKLVECAINGEGWAICQIGDRLDGRPAQDNSHELKGEIKVTLRQMLEDDE